MEVVTQHLDQRRAFGIAPEGLSCAQLVDAYAPPIAREHVVVYVSGVLVPPEWWAKVTPKQHALVIVAIVPGKGGGGGKKNTFAMIASIAIAIAAPGIGGALANAAFAGVGGSGLVLGFGITAGQAFGLAVGFAANLALGAIFKPSQPSISAATASTSASSSSPTYSLAGQSNLLDPFGPVRRIFGIHRIYPVVVGRPYVEVYGDDQYLTTLYDIGAGDYDVSDVRIGASHIGYFQNASYNVHRNTKAPQLSWYYGARHAEQFSLTLAPDWVMADTVTDAGQFVVTFIFPQGIAAIDATTGATLLSFVRFNLEWSDFGVGNWAPVESAYWWTASRQINPNSGTNAEVTGGELIREDGVYGNPGSGSDGLLRSPTVTQTRGYPVGAAVITLRAQSFLMAAGAKFTYNGTTYTVGANVLTTAPTAVPIDPPLQTEIVTQVTLITEEEGTVDQYVTPPLVVLYDPGGGNYMVQDSRIQQLTLAVTIRPTAALVAGKRYSIRARQTVGFGDERTTYGDMVLVGVETMSAVAPALNLRNEHTLLEMRVKANEQVSGVLEDLSCFAGSYLFVRRAGAWSYEVSRNPAWALWEVLTGKMNKRPVSQAKLDLVSFEAWADYCDELHPTHAQPRAQLDLVVDYYTTVFALAQTITAAGRATLGPGDGVMRVLIDRPQVNPVQVFTPHNSKSFTGSRTFIEAPHAFRAKFMSRDTWKVEEQLVYNDGYTAANATVFESIDLPGITRAGQVWTDSRYRMAQGIHRQEAWQLDVDIDNMICTRGDLVHVAHDVPQLGGLPSRIKEVTYAGALATQWKLTEPVDLGGTPGAFGFTIRSLNGVIHQGAFGAQLDPYTVAPAVPLAGITVGDLHVWGELTKVTYPFIVAAINPQPDQQAALTLVPYAGDAIFGADTGAIPPYDPVVDDDLSTLAPPAIARVTILQTLVYTNRRPLLTVSFDWRDYSAPTFAAYEVWIDWSINTTGSPVLLGRTVSPHFEWLTAIDLTVFRSYPGSTFCVKVLAVNAFGAKRTLAETPATCDTVLGDFDAPAAPPLFELDLKRDTITLAWEHPDEPDIDYYEVRYSPRIADAMFSEATLLSPQIPYPSRSFDVPARLGTYFIKAIDTSGNRSDEYASAFTPADNLWNLNVITTWDDAPAWPGSKDGFIVNGGALESVQLSPGEFPRLAEYRYAEIFDNGAVYQTRFTSQIIAAGFTVSSFMSEWIPLEVADPIAGTVVLDAGGTSEIAELIDVWHEVRWVTVENVMSDWLPLASADPIGLGEANFGPWRRFLVGDFIGQQFQFRLMAAYIGPDLVADVGVTISDAHIDIDMHDRTDGVFDELCPVGGMRVLYLPAFKERPAISITQDTFAAGDTYAITNADRTGFDIIFRNTGLSVARQFDWLARGYGAQSTRVVDALVRKGTRKPVTFVTTRRAA